MNATIVSLLIVSVLLAVGCSKSSEQAPPKETSDEPMLHVPSPDWRDQIIYFLMTDRFNDGDPSNNDQGAGEYDPAHESHYSGGDIQGIIEQLDYIQALGATAVWTTPIVANQWWSHHAEYGGYHGYWATDFSDVDKHKGDFATYQRLSDQLHRRGMYLIKDIVVNHTGNFFNYRGGLSGYDPNDTARNFYFLEPRESLQTQPTQSPFDLIDRNNPAHVDAGIYNWTPSISDFRNEAHQFTYQLASLADINTLNPVVIDKFKHIYGEWIQKAGVDAFRIDTVRYVEHEFFDRFMNDDDGILAIAEATGRHNFLAFGEVFDTSKPYQNDAEHRVASYLGSAQQPLLNSIISFPLHHEFKTVFAQGLPTDHLGYRIRQHMNVYPDPYVLPIFIDNHDMERFLASGDLAGFKQALTALFTLPGIPTIYQGSEQAMTISRQAMFAEGFASDRDHFNRESELFTFIQSLAALRSGDRVFTRGDIDVIATDKRGAGIFAYTRSYEGRRVLVLFNTSRQPILANRIRVHTEAAMLTPLLGADQSVVLDDQGQLTIELGGRAVMVMEVMPIEKDAAELSRQHIAFTTHQPEGIVRENYRVQGRSSLANQKLLLVKNARLDTAVSLQTNAEGAWSYEYPVRNLGEERVSLVAYDPKSGASSEALVLTTAVDEPEWSLSIADPVGDDHGPTGTYLPPQHDQSIGQQDIVRATVKIGGEVLQLSLTMKAVTDDWIPANGFDNVAFSIFIDSDSGGGIAPLPLLNSTMPEDRAWDLGHVAYGWSNTTFTHEKADETRQGIRLGVAPPVNVDISQNTVTFQYRASDLGIGNWQGSMLYVTTWDISGEGLYRDLNSEKNDWHYGGGEPDGEKIMDSLLVHIPAW